MTEPIERDTVTDAGVIESPDSSLALSEIADRFLWSVQPHHQGNLNTFAEAVFGSAPRPGEVLKMESLRLLQLWPHKAWLLASSAQLSHRLEEFSGIMTDIGHGYCEFRLTGEPALDFLGSYTSANPADQCAGAEHSLRCLLGQYPLVLWWEDSADIRLLVERSCARSFYDYIASLMARWSQQSS
jgi:sarcosine oxidase gamma subunit